MAYNLIGCMEDNDGKFRPRWVNPCTSEVMLGCMVEANGKFAPKLEGGFGQCTDDKTGCMELNNGKYRPVLTFDEYANFAALTDDCCLTCTHCFGEGQAPAFVKLTFADVLRCPKNSPLDPHGTVPDGDFIIPWDGGFAPSICRWILDEGAGTGTFFMLVAIHIVSSILIITVQIHSYEGAFLYIMYDYYQHAWSCADTGPFANDQVLSHCNTFPHNIHTYGYDGTVTIDWSP